MFDISPYFFYFLETEQNIRNYKCCNIQNIESGEKTKGDFLLCNNLKIYDQKY